MEKHNVEFIEKAAGYKWLDREDIVVDLNDTEVQQGDFLAITRFDGLDQLMYTIFIYIPYQTIRNWKSFWS